MKNFTIVLIVLIILGSVWYFIFKKPSNEAIVLSNENVLQNNEPATSTPVVKGESSEIVIGKSVEGRDIVAYNYGQGEKYILFIGGIHGGYSWNTTLVSYELMDYLKTNPDIIPKNIKLTIIPSLNPDGLNKVVDASNRFTKGDVSSSKTIQISSRYNANKVDLSRNFDCDWQSVGKWQNTNVSGGNSVFSEPESLAIKDYVESHSLNAVVVWYSSAGGVYSSSCGDSILPETKKITDIYAKASGYPGYDSFDFYKTSGDIVNWLAKKNIPAISILLSNHEDTEWNKNKKGVEALLEYFAK